MNAGHEDAKKVMRRTLGMLEPKQPSTLDMFHVVFKTRTGEYGASPVFDTEEAARAHAELAYRPELQARVARVTQFRCPISGEWLP